MKHHTSHYLAQKLGLLGHAFVLNSRCQSHDLRSGVKDVHQILQQGRLWQNPLPST